MQLNIHISHIYREANQLADFMEKIAIEHEQSIQHDEFNQLPSTGRKIINIDKQQIPVIRVKTRKISNTHN